MLADKFSRAITLIDSAHARDPTQTTRPDPSTGTSRTLPYELHYAQLSSYYLSLLEPSASEVLGLAVRAQHFRRWEIPRSSYPMTRIGYHSWRTFLKKRQGAQAAELCCEAGYSSEEADRVAALVRKDGLTEREHEACVLEDVACLVFLDDQFAEFEEKHDEEKIIGILRKTWGKMSPAGQKMATELRMEGRPAELMKRALTEGQSAAGEKS
ncbi:MAG: hypothetical protein M1831_000553 [Alyxoria varia]|nr:MAG: hypothetical protein M1831_000553 [Alyxoria varia]